MRKYLKRLVTTGAAYQAADIVAKCFAVVLLPLYTRHVPSAGYGAYNTLLTSVILASIVLRLGIATPQAPAETDSTDSTEDS